jgi:type I restriction enzyme S subunit
MVATGWSSTKIRAVADVRVSNVDKKYHSSETAVLLCNYNDVYYNEAITGSIEFMRASASTAEIERFGLQRGDVVITKDSESPDDIGVSTVVAEDVDDLVCGYHLALLRPRNGKINSVYLAKQLRTAASIKYFGVNASGTTRFGLPIGAIEEMDIPLAPKPEQDQIAAVLSTVDRLIEQQAVLIAKLERIKLGLMQSLLTYGIDSDGRLRSEETHKCQDSELGRIPFGWCVTTIGEQFELRAERGLPGLPVMSIMMSEGLVERSSVDRRVDSKLSAEGHALVRAGDIAYNMMRMWQGVLGRASFDCLVSPAYVVLQPRGSADSRFMEWLFRDRRSIREFRRWSRGVVDDRLRLYPSDLFPIKIAMPTSLDEQGEIARRLDAIKSRIDAEMVTLQKSMRLRPGLMQDLLSGERRVTALLQPTGR